MDFESSLSNNKPLSLPGGHPSNCACDVCSKGKEFTKSKQAKAIRTKGWSACAVSLTKPIQGLPYGYDFHTHNLRQYLNIPDFQVVLPIDPRLAYYLIEKLIEKVKAGEKVERGMTFSGLIQEGDILIAEVPWTLPEGEVVILSRIILPDENGLLYGELEGMSEKYSRQWDGASI